MVPPQASSAGPTSDRRIGVLWLIKGLGPGGAEQLLVSAARVADHDRFDYTAAYLVPAKNQLVPVLAGYGVPSALLGGGRRGGLLWPWRLRRLILQARPRVVHAHSPVPASVARLVSRTLARAARPAVVTTEHNVRERYNPMTRWLNELTAPLDSRRWGVSAKVTASTPPRLRRSTQTLVHGIVSEDIHATAPDARECIRDELGLSPDDLLITTVANLRDQKDYPNLLAAAVHVARADPRAHFLAVGQGPLEPEIRQLHQSSGLGDRFRLAGYRDDVMDVLEASDLFVLASKFEGYPIAVMEAMAMGLPVVSTNVGGVPDAVTEGVEGLLVSPGDAAALAAAVLRVLGDDEGRLAMGRAARLRGVTFDIRNAVRVIESAYAELAEERR